MTCIQTFTTPSGCRAAVAVVRPLASAALVHLRLVVNVGSFHEHSDERGAAHFIEHLAFRATSAHDHGQLIQEIEASGAKFGADLNAKTSTSSTVYQLDIPAALLPRTSAPAPVPA
jgi:predicted Zn-dependent peptidase